jgi:hypothetical protein
VLEIPRIVPSFSLPQVDSVADLESYSRSVPVHVRGVGSFDRLDNGAWCPLDIHPEYSNYTLVGALLASALDPADPDAAVTDDLPEGWTKSGAGALKLVGESKLQLTSGAGTACDLSVALPTLDADADYLTLLMVHSWAADNSLADTAANRLHMALRIALGNRVALWSSASPTAGWAAFWSTAGAGIGLGPTGQPRGVMSWERIDLQKGAVGHASGARRYSGTGQTKGILAGMRRDAWSTNTEANAATWHAAEGTTLEVESVLLFRQ